MVAIITEPSRKRLLLLDALLHLGDVQTDVALHLHILFASTLDLILDVLFQISHLRRVSRA